MRRWFVLVVLLFGGWLLVAPAPQWRLAAEAVPQTTREGGRNKETLRKGEQKRERHSPSLTVARNLAPLAGGQHEFFEGLRNLPQHVADWSLRDQAQLDDLTGRGKSEYFTYVFGRDPYPEAKDGAKFLKPVDDAIGKSSDSIPGNQQLRMPIGVDRGAVLITWDFWYGKEFRTNVGRVAHYKTFQVRQGDGKTRSGRRWWTHVNSFASPLSAGEVAYVLDAVDPTGLAFPAGVSRAKPLGPAGVGAAGGRSFPIRYGRWTRYWIEIVLSVSADDPRWSEWKSTSADAAKLSGRWDMLSLWIADETTNPVRIIYRVPWMRKLSHISSFDFEFNTSTKPPAQAGPLVGYGRNVVVLRDYVLPAIPETDGRIFVRPVP